MNKLPFNNTVSFCDSGAGDYTQWNINQELRYNKEGKLQQKWVGMIVKGFAPQNYIEEWRDVPTEE